MALEKMGKQKHAHIAQAERSFFETSCIELSSFLRSQTMRELDSCPVVNIFLCVFLFCFPERRRASLAFKRLDLYIHPRKSKQISNYEALAFSSISDNK